MVDEISIILCVHIAITEGDTFPLGLHTSIHPHTAVLSVRGEIVRATEQSITPPSSYSTG